MHLCRITITLGGCSPCSNKHIQITGYESCNVSKLNTPISRAIIRPTISIHKKYGTLQGDPIITLKVSQNRNTLSGTSNGTGRSILLVLNSYVNSAFVETIISASWQLNIK